MKKMLVVAAFVFAATGAFAQNAGELWVGLDFDFDFSKEKAIAGSTKDDVSKSFNFGIAPRGEYFLMQDLSLFGGIGFGFTKNTTFNDPADDFIEKTPEFGIFAGAAKYFKLGDKLSLFAAAELAFDWERTNTEVGSTTTKGNPTRELMFSVYPGIQYLLGDKVAIYATLGNGLYFSTHTTIDADDSDNKNRTTDFGLNLFTGEVMFGVKYKLF